MVIDSHAHPGLEKKGIKDRPGCADFWLGKTWEVRLLRKLREALGDRHPERPIEKIEDIPIFSVEHWIQDMDRAGVNIAVLCGMDAKTDPPYEWWWHVSNEYMKEEFIDKYPDRFIAQAGINPKKGPKECIKEVEKAIKEFRFKGIKIFTPAAGFPNNKELMYPIYEKLVELKAHVAIHTGVEGHPGTRLKYQDPIYVDDIGVDFPELKIYLLHCGLLHNPSIAIYITLRHKNVYTDVSPSNPIRMQYPKYYTDIEHLRYCEFAIPDKIMFGTDYPFTYPMSLAVEYFRTLPLSDKFKENLFEKTARKFFEL